MPATPSLHALSIAELLDRAVRLYRSNFLALISLTGVVFIPIMVLYVAAYGLFGTGADESGSMLVMLLSLAEGILQLAATLALMAALAQAYIAQPLALGEAYSQGNRRYLTVLGASILVGLAVGVPAAIVGVVGALAGCAFIGVIIIIPAAVFLGTRWSMATPAIVLEDLGAIEGLKRSWNLTANYFWRVFGTSVLASLLVFAVAQIPALIIRYTLTAFLENIVVTTILSTIFAQLATLITLPLSTAVTVLIYYDLRVRQEGFDLELQTQQLAATLNPPDQLPPIPPLP